ncbi:Di-copper centre-containing protein [Lentinula aff. detonsa]|uniref:Di-copper centre-containing protein n=1 Tax=Lentinula aff. detonsa TaxID=2804958 RepID=A0AA38NNV5_9AGAR|nr:Di-copper centre-containing protein [Lentinula aff. detonsa]
MLAGIGFTLFVAARVLLAASTCTDPSVRKEWRTLTKDERAEWIGAVKCLSELPHDSALTPSVHPDDIAPLNTSSSYYDDIVYVHMDLNHLVGFPIHFTGLFLPFHRWYVQVYEYALKEKCGFKGASPYWNWAEGETRIDAPNFFNSTVFQDFDPISGLGGWGNLLNDAQVPNGAFSDFKLSYPSYHTLRRNFTLQPYIGQDPTLFTEPYLYANTSFTQSEVDKMVSGFVGDYKGFQTYLEAFEGAHSSVHLIMGGDLGGTCPSTAPPDCTPGPTFSANEPLFWMHHAMVDKVWFDWQNANPANADIFYGGSVQMIDNGTIYNKYPNGGPPMLSLDSVIPADGMFQESTIEAVINTTTGLLCYIYD